MNQERFNDEPRTTNHERLNDAASLIAIEEPTSLPDRPTEAPRGSRDRIEEYARRAAAGVHLYHPEDNDDGVHRRSHTDTAMRRGRRV
jgi:hypothetical protein